MSNANRAGVNVGKSSKLTQSVNTPKNPPGETQPASNAVTIRFTGQADGATLNLAELQISDEVYFALKVVAEEKGVGLEELMPQIIRERIAAEDLASFSLAGHEKATNRACATMDLLESKLLAIYEAELRAADSAHNSAIASLVTGYMDLIDDAQEALRACHKAVCQFVRGKGSAR